MRYDIHCGNAIDVLRTLPNASVHCCVTSPPYYGLRDYGTGAWDGGDAECDHLIAYNDIDPKRGRALASSHQVRRTRTSCHKCGAVRVDEQIGLEESIDEYIARLVSIFAEVRRVLRDDGTLWINIGDSYNAQSVNTGQHGYKDGRTNRSQRHAVSCKALAPKQLLLVPQRLAIALQDDGWFVRQDVIWHKTNPMPESVKDRCTKAHEYIFLLSKKPTYYYDTDAIREKTGNEATWAEYNAADGRFHDHKNDLTAGMLQKHPEGFREMTHPAGRNKRSVWSVPTKPYKGAHFALFPPDLIRPCVLAGSPEGGTVLDPFAGSGTTGEVALTHSRRFVGIELNNQYIPLIQDRLRAVDYTLFDKE